MPLWGAVGGFLATLAAQLLTALADRFGGSTAWLKGPYGPPFFNISLFMGVVYGGIAWSLSRRRQHALLGALGPFLGIVLPMAVMTRVFPWSGSLEAPDPRWVNAVVAVYALAVWGTVAALGWRLGGGWRGAALSASFSFASYLLLSLLLRLAPNLAAWPWRAGSLLPQPNALLDGLLTGGGIGASVVVARRWHEKRSSH